ncbi:hypothetical protein V8F33_013695, partial [Rhypophila sp. PSN 637]
NKALKYLQQLEPGAIQKANNLPPPDKKRKATSGLAICVQCEESFDPDDNRVKECRYHNGELEPDHDADIWADHDENCHGGITADSFGKSHSEGFIWTCCEKPGDEEGCKLGRHEENPELNKRRRDFYDQSKDDEEDEEDDEEEDDEEEDDEEEDDEDVESEVLNALCADETIRTKALEHLRSAEPANRARATARITAPPTLAVCVQCEEAFDTADNNDSTACQHHDGDLEYDEESNFWCDYYDGPSRYSEEAKELYPGGFIYSCCGKDGEQDGCKVGRHAASWTRTKRGY